MSLAESRLREAGLLLISIAAGGGVRTGCAVQIGVLSFPLRGVDGSPIRIVEAHLRVPDPAEAQFLAAVLWPDVAEPRIAGLWVWRGWIVGDSSSIPVSITLASDSDAAPTTPGGTPAIRNRPVPLATDQTILEVALRDAPRSKGQQR